MDECERHGVVNSFSAYKYENAIMSVKSMKRSSNKILQQLGNCTMRNVYYSRIANKPRSNSFRIDSDKNSCFITRDRSIVKVINVDINSSEVEDSTFSSHTYLFSLPFPSSQLDIHVLDGLSNKNVLMPASSLITKCFLLPYDENGENKLVSSPTACGWWKISAT